MYRARIILFALFMSLSAGAFAQAVGAGGGSYGLMEGDVPRGEVGLNYNFIHANAPPGQCGCFSLNGGSATFALNLRPRWAGIADITVAHSNNVNDTGQDITLIHYLFGVRYSKRTRGRYVMYGQGLFGGAKEDVNFQFDINRNAFGVMVGGGVSARLRDHVGWTIGELDWVYSQVPNGVNNRQNDTRVVTGFIYRY
jgi:peptidoglycan-associated lipoprotein